MKVMIDGTTYQVVENCGIVHDVGMRVVFVDDGGRERKAAKDSTGPWRFWGAADRVAPLFEAKPKQLLR